MSSIAGPASQKMIALGGEGMRRLADLVYPPTCTGCGVMTGSHSAFCAECWTGIRFIERPYCEVLGIPFSYDIGPGMLSAGAIADPPVFDRLRAAVIHEGAARDLVHGLKFRDRTERAAMMARWMLRPGGEHLAACHAIVPVPLHLTRFLHRRFNQSAEIGRALSRLSGRPFLSATLLRTKRTGHQVGLTASAREDNVRGAFSIAAGREGDVFGKRIVLVDDVYTTGATVSAATRTLKRAGAAEVTVLTFAMAISGPI